MTDSHPRNPGPSWGFALIRFFNRWTPEPIFGFLLHLGATVAVPLLPARARASRNFLSTVMDRPAAWADVRRHFIAFADFLVLRFRTAGGRPHQCVLDPEKAGDFMERVSGADPLLFGTFHLGHSDLLGFWLTDFDRSIRMVRVRTGNSDDLKWLHQRYSGKVDFIWANDPADIPFSIRDAIENGHSVAMKCDRTEFSSRTAIFDFLGLKCVFPVTIYHLSLLFRLPVILAFGLDDGFGGTRIVSLPAFVPGASERSEELERAHLHFQRALRLAEDIIRGDPCQWFNFEPLKHPTE
ncbi:MAG: hypothetical protein DRP71_08685 [Verrucomicrobia bacterium]|nr:MAG: hypothetical protein DRP71_08685 [Verrucomicrobiota bacterium]